MIGENVVDPCGDKHEELIHELDPPVNSYFKEEINIVDSKSI